MGTCAAICASDATASKCAYTAREMHGFRNKALRTIGPLLLLVTACDPTVATNRGAGATSSDASLPPVRDVNVVQPPDGNVTPDATNPTPDASVPDASVPDASVPKQLARVMGTNSTLNLRSGPSTNDAVVASIPEGCLVTLLGETNGAWLKVDYRGTVGWCHSDYLSEVQPDAADCSL